MTDYPRDKSGTYSCPTTGKPLENTYLRYLYPKASQNRNDAYITSGNGTRGPSSYSISHGNWQGSFSDTRPPNIQVGPGTVGGRISETSHDLTGDDNMRFNSNPFINSQVNHSTFTPTNFHRDVRDATLYEMTLNPSDMNPLGGPSNYYANFSVSSPYSRTNARAVPITVDDQYGSYQSGSPLTFAYMGSSFNPNSTVPLDQPILYSYSLQSAHSPPAGSLLSSRSEEIGMDSVPNQVQRSYTDGNGIQPRVDGSGDPPPRRRWSTDNNQGSVNGDSAGQITQGEDTTRSYEDTRYSEGNIDRYVRDESPWALGYNMSTGRTAYG
ncbi:hypothetical protein F5Y11DRAFT_365281 [Daldinia sp. FL1419]|nr:hypothetical protein F5Y11DRAFT_365281 [Daldinia sp. FL1419]